MAGIVLLQPIMLILVVFLLNGVCGESYRDRCRKDLSECMSYGGYACQGGGNIRCRQRGQLCDGSSDCPWGEDEIICGRPLRPRPTTFITRTIVRTSTRTQTKTTTTTQSATTTTHTTTTSTSTTTTSTTTTSTPTFSLAPSSASTQVTITSVLPIYTAVTRLNVNEAFSGGSVCTLTVRAAGAAFAAGDFRIMKMSTSATITGAATASCSAAVTTIS